MTVLKIARHGQSMTNAGIPGIDHEDQNMLTELGIEQSVNLGRQLLGTGFVPDAVMVSTLPRAQQTAMNALSALGRPAGLSVHRELDEMRVLPDKKFVHESVLRSEHGDEHVDRAFDDPDYLGFADGETGRDVYERSVGFLIKRIVPELESGRNVLVITHFFVIRAMLSYLSGRGLGSMHRYFPDNCEPFTHDLESIIVAAEKAA